MAGISPPTAAGVGGRADDRQVGVGRQLREHRRRLDLTLEEVAARAGLTKGYLSQVERGLASPSVAALLAICEALGIRIGELFEATDSVVVRGGDRRPIEFGGTGISEFLLSPSPRSRLQVIWSELAPAATGGPEAWSLPAEEEMVLVLDGTIMVAVRDVEHQLESGDALTFDPRQLHRFWNASDTEPARAVFIVTPSPYA